MSRSSGVRLPAARYLIAATRLRPGLDGGYTVATMRRAQLLRDAGAEVELLTFDPTPLGDALAGFIALGLADDGTRMRNLFAELRERPELLRAAELHPLAATHDHQRSTLIAADDGTPLLRLPYVERADWHRADADIEIYAADGIPLGALHGFGELYRLWVDLVAAEATPDDQPVVLISEARQLGELLVARPRDYAIVHTVHNAHTEPPHAWDSELGPLWEAWFETVDRYDGVIWLTKAQRADAVRRFGEHPNWAVVPHPAPEVDPGSDRLPRDPHRAVMIARLAPQKRVDDAIRAWPAVLQADPDARLDIFGDGPQRAELERLVLELELSDRVTLRGHTNRVADELAGSAALLLTSRYEGQGLAIAEALAAGTPVVAYDIHYGPAEMVRDGVSGALVAPGDVAALADAVAGILGHPDRITELSRGARSWAAAHGADRARADTAELLHAVLLRRSVIHV